MFLILEERRNSEQEEREEKAGYWKGEQKFIEKGKGRERKTKWKKERGTKKKWKRKREKWNLLKSCMQCETWEK